MKPSAIEGKKYRLGQRCISAAVILLLTFSPVSSFSAFPDGASVWPEPSLKDNIPSLVFEPISDVAINAGNLVSLSLKAKSVSEAPLRYEAADLPDGAALVDNEFTWQPSADLAGEYKLVFKAMDGVSTAEQTVTFFFVPSGKSSALPVSSGSSRRSALVLPGSEGWIVVIASQASRGDASEGTVRKEDLGESDKPLREGEFRADGDGDIKVGPNVTVVPDDGTFIGGGFFPFSNTGLQPQSTAPPPTTTPPPTADPKTVTPSPPAPNIDELLFRLLGNTPSVNPNPSGMSPFHNTFTDVTAVAGLGNAFGRAAAFHDVDDDGILDLYVANPYRDLENSFFVQFEPDPLERSILFRGTLSSGEVHFTDQTQTYAAEIRTLSDPALELERPQGILFADIDNDGDRDMFMPNFGRENALLRSAGAGQPFTNISQAAGVNDTGESFGALFADFNLDGRVDIFVAGGRGADRLYVNQGNGSFEDQAASLGVNGSATAVGAVAFDADRDGDSDLLVLNFVSPVQLFKNNLVPSGIFSFTDVAASSGLVSGGLPIGVETGDLDNDGRIDLFLADLGTARSKLFQNTTSSGNISFSDRTAALTSALSGSALSPASGAAFLDIHNDGLSDVYVVTENAENVMFRNNGNFSFTEVTEAEVVKKPDFADSVATLDYNADGLTDIFIASTPSLLYKNITVNNLNWLKVDLAPLAQITNRDAIGAVVSVARTDGVTLTQEISGGTGRSQDSRILHFGMGATTQASTVTVTWPTTPARTITLTAGSSNLAVNRTLVIGDSGSPIFTAVPTATVPAGRGISDSFDLRVLDPDGNNITLTVTPSDLNVFETTSLTKTGMDSATGAEIWTFSYTPKTLPNTEADVSLVFSASDGAGTPTTATAAMHIFSSEMFNIAPRFDNELPSAVISAVEGAAINPIVFTAADMDLYQTGVLNATLAVTPPVSTGTGPHLVDVNNPAVQISNSGKIRPMRLEWTPAFGAASPTPYTVTVTLSDGIESVSDSFQIQVNAGVPPVLPNPPTWVDASFPANNQIDASLATPFTLNLLVDSDTNGKPDLISYDGVNSNLVFGISDVNGRNASITNGLFSYTPAFSEMGTQAFTLTVRDTLTPGTIDSFTLSIHIIATLAWNSQALSAAASAQMPLVAGAGTLTLNLSDFISPPGMTGLTYHVHPDSSPAFSDAQISGSTFSFSPDGSMAGQSLNLKFEAVRSGEPPIVSGAIPISLAVAFLFKDVTTDATAGQGAGYFGTGPAPAARRAAVVDFMPDLNGSDPLNPSRERNGLDDLLLVAGDGSAVLPYVLTTPTPGNFSALKYQGLPAITGTNVASVLSADFDNDGFKDFYVVTKTGANQMYKNTDGDSFVLQTSTGAEDSGSGNGALIGDIDNDGKIDLYVLNDGANKLFRNTSNAGVISFADITAQTATAGSDADTRAGALIDINEDGLLDILLIHLDGDNEILFNSSASASSAFLPAPATLNFAHTGVSGDRALALSEAFIFVLNENPAACRLLKIDAAAADVAIGTGVTAKPFADVFSASGIDLSSVASGALRDAAFGDMDNDGTLDLLIAPATGEVLIFKSDGAGHFSRLASTGIQLAAANTLESLTLLDINQDGLLDVLAVGSASQIFLNENDSAAAENHYLEFALEGDPASGRSAKDAPGAVVTVFPLGVGGNPLTRRLSYGTGASGDSPVVHIGLGSLEDIGLITVAWPSGAVQEISDTFDLEVDQRYRVLETDSGSGPLSLDVTLKNVSDNAAATTLHFTPSLTDTFVEGEQYLDIQFQLSGTNTSVSMFTDNQASGPAFTGTYTKVNPPSGTPALRGSGLIGVTNKDVSVPMLWKVFSGVQTGGVAFVNDADVLEGALLDMNYPGFSLEPSLFPEDFVHHELAHIDPIQGGLLGAFPPDSVSERSFNANAPAPARVYFAADFAGAPAADYATRIKVVLIEVTP